MDNYIPPTCAMATELNNLQKKVSVEPFGKNKQTQ